VTDWNDDIPEPPGTPVEWKRLLLPDGRRLDYQLVGSRAYGNRRLLVVEIDREAEQRVPAAIAALAGGVEG
jgi:hypothetical protein